MSLTPAEQYRQLVDLLEGIESKNLYESIDVALNEGLADWIKKAAVGLVAAGALGGVVADAHADVGRDIASAAMCSAVYRAGHALLDGKLKDEQGIKSERAMNKALQLAQKYGASKMDVYDVRNNTLEKYMNLAKTRPRDVGAQVAGDLRQCDAVMNQIN